MRKVCLFLFAVVACGLSAGAQETIFANGFEEGRACWVWSTTVGGDELCFEVPYQEPPPVALATVEYTTPPLQADVVIAMDTTASMSEEISELKSSISSVLASLLGLIPDCGFSVVGYDDYPYDPYGVPGTGDRAFYLLHRAMTARTSNGLNSLVAAVDSYTRHAGNDGPESGWEMVYQVATGAGSGALPYGVPPFDPAIAPPSVTPGGEETGTFGGVGLRAGSLPILAWITDAPSHQSDVTGNYYGPIPGVTPHSSTEALVALNALSGRIVGIVSDPAQGQTDVEHGVVQTGAVVTPDAWGQADRPPGCDPSECCTGLNGVGVPPVGGSCPLTYRIDSQGHGLDLALVDGVERVIGLSILDIGATLEDKPGDPIDAPAAFVDRLEADASAPPPCAQGLVAVDVNPVDGIPDTFLEVEPEATPCFELVLKTNTILPSAGTEQVFGATIQIVGDGVTVLDTRDVFFRVPAQ